MSPVCKILNNSLVIHKENYDLSDIGTLWNYQFLFLPGKGREGQQSSDFLTRTGKGKLVDFRFLYDKGGGKMV